MRIETGTAGIDIPVFGISVQYQVIPAQDQGDSGIGF
jgi:hypothetical protein